MATKSKGSLCGAARPPEHLEYSRSTALAALPVGRAEFQNATGPGSGTGHLNTVTGVISFWWDGRLILGNPGNR
ncbi:hypothetical protein BH20VER2_BH20VER2_14990 [soil metagenome]